MLADGIDSDWSGLHVVDRNYLNGHNQGDGQVDMLDIPGKGRCSVYIARYFNKLQNILFIFNWIFFTNSTFKRY